METAERLRDTGIKQSMDNANHKNPNWTDMALNFLITYAKSNPEFLCEDVRKASIGKVPHNVNSRSWGGVFVKASKLNIIEFSRYERVKNKNAHCTPATLWSSKILELKLF